MDECKDTWYPFSWYCPNCGTQLIGFKNAEGMIKVECKRCLAVSVRKVMGRRHNRIDILKDGRTCILRNGTEQDGQALPDLSSWNRKHSGEQL